MRLFIEVYTDNNPLTYILSTAKLDATGHRWVASLGPYNFSLHYKPGKLNSDADALSRIDWQSVEAPEVRATMDLAQVDRSVIIEPSVFQDTVENIPTMKSLRIGDSIRQWQQRQNEDPDIKIIIQMINNETWAHYRYNKKDPESMKSYIKVRSELVVHQGLLYRKLRLKNRDEDTYQFVVPTDFRRTALSLAHVTGSNFNKYPAACKSAELIDWTHKQLKRITFVKQQVYSMCNQGKYPT